MQPPQPQHLLQCPNQLNHSLQCHEITITNTTTGQKILFIRHKTKTGPIAAQLQLNRLPPTPGAPYQSVAKESGTPKSRKLSGNGKLRNGVGRNWSKSSSYILMISPNQLQSLLTSYCKAHLRLLSQSQGQQVHLCRIEMQGRQGH